MFWLCVWRYNRLFSNPAFEVYAYILLKSCTDLANRGEESSKSTHLINVDIKDNHEDALLGGRAILQLAQMVCGKYLSTSYSLLLTVCTFCRSKHRKILITKYRRSLSDLLNGIQHIQYFTRLHTIRITVFIIIIQLKKKMQAHWFECLGHSLSFRVRNSSNASSPFTRIKSSIALYFSNIWRSISTLPSVSPLPFSEPLKTQWGGITNCLVTTSPGMAFETFLLTKAARISIRSPSWSNELSSWSFKSFFK